MGKNKIAPAEGKLGVLCVGLGAVTTTMIAGCRAFCKSGALLGGSISQLARIRVGRGADKKYLKVDEIVPMCPISEMVFGGWDIYSGSVYQRALEAEVLKPSAIEPLREELEAIRPMKAVFDPEYVSRLHGDYIKENASRMEYVEALRADIRQFKQDTGCERIVVIWAASTEKFIAYDKNVHGSEATLRQAMIANDTEHIAPSMCYAYAALLEGAPFVMGAPNLCIDIPAIWEVAERTKTPIAGKDFKTGQTLMKTVLAPMINVRQLGVSGWFSTNILGNMDGEVLADPQNFHTKEVSKLGVLDTILRPSERPDLYGDMVHQVHINYYPPRGDQKEAWDNIDIFGWMGQDYGMQIKVNFLCRDSILAAPIMLDLVLFSDLAARAGLWGTQRWLSFYLKSPMHDYTQGEEPVHDVFQQYIILKNALRELGGYEADEELD